MKHKQEAVELPPTRPFDAHAPAGRVRLTLDGEECLLVAGRYNYHGACSSLTLRRRGETIALSVNSMFLARFLPPGYIYAAAWGEARRLIPGLILAGYLTEAPEHGTLRHPNGTLLAYKFNLHPGAEGDTHGNQKEADEAGS
jgi:hypothetical protein